MSYKSDIAIIPGKTLAHVLEKAGMSQVDLSIRTGLSEKHISQIITGKTIISLDTALKLERVLGGSADFWVSLEKQYQENKARLELEEKLVSEIKIADKYPYLELVKNGIIGMTRDKKERVQNLLKFFAVDSLFFIRETEAVAFRRVDTEKISKEALATWLRFGELEAKKVQARKFDKSLLKSRIKKLKKLTFLPENFAESLKVECEECGVIILFTPYFKNTYVNGAVRWIGDNPVVQLTIRNAFSDIFWFTFFHEIGHIMLHGKKDQFVDFEDKIDKEVNDDKEREANIFACDSLVNYDDYKKFVDQKDFSHASIRSFAKKENVDPGIIAGRLAHEKLVGWQKVNHFRKRLTLKKA